MSEIDSWSTAAESFKKFCETIAALRHPITGCPWDLAQSHSTLRRYMLEEAYEAAEVMEPVNYAKLCEELGDVLLQVVLNSQLAKDEKKFSVNDVIKSIDAKMRRRHPHVFATSEIDRSDSARQPEKIRAKWEEVKEAEKAAKGETQQNGVFEHLKPGSVRPASHLALEIGKTAKQISFDWNSPKDVFKQFESEVQELKDELWKNDNQELIYDEMGDVFFSLSQLCRHLGIDPEVCAMDGNRKFLSRFANLELLARREGIEVGSAGTLKLEELWNKAKKLEKLYK